MFFFFFQAEDGIRDTSVTGVQTCALPIYVWDDAEVWWDRLPKTITKEFDGLIMTWTEFPAFDWHPWIDKGYIEKLIEDGKVRVRE